MEKTALFTIKKIKVYQLNKGDIILFNNQPHEISYIMKYVNRTNYVNISFTNDEDVEYQFTSHETVVKIKFVYRLK